MDESLQNLQAKLNNWLESFILLVPNILLALLVFAAAYFLSKWIRTLLNKILEEKFKQPSVRNLIASIASIGVITAGLFLALEILDLNKALTSVLAGAGVAGLAVGLALQGTLANTFSGIFLSVKDIVTVGDFIQTNGYTGIVDEITLRYLRLREPDNNIVIIPNRMVVENPFKNYSLTEKMRITMKCGVAYDSDLDYVRDISIECIKRLFPEDPEHRTEFHYLEFGGSSIDFQIRFWTEAKSKKDLFEMKSVAMMALKAAFDKANISIPFPMRTLTFDQVLEIQKA